MARKYTNYACTIPDRNKRPNKKSIYKNIDIYRGGYRSRITIANVRYFIGIFKTEKEAMEATLDWYDKFRRGIVGNGYKRIQPIKSVTSVNEYILGKLLHSSAYVKMKDYCDFLDYIIGLTNKLNNEDSHFTLPLCNEMRKRFGMYCTKRPKQLPKYLLMRDIFLESKIIIQVNNTSKRKRRFRLTSDFVEEYIRLCGMVS